MHGRTKINKKVAARGQTKDKKAKHLPLHQHDRDARDRHNLALPGGVQMI
jgi:hypothetical protein